MGAGAAAGGAPATILPLPLSSLLFELVLAAPAPILPASAIPLRYLRLSSRTDYDDVSVVVVIVVVIVISAIVVVSIVIVSVILSLLALE